MECIKKNEQNSNDCRISSSITYKQHYFGVCIWSSKQRGFYDQSDIDKGYIIKHKDGTYELVLGKTRFKISNPNDDCFKAVPIIKE